MLDDIITTAENLLALMLVMVFLVIFSWPLFTLAWYAAMLNSAAYLAY